jgi:hypothetical protein
MWDFFEPEDNQWYRWDLNGASAFLQKMEDAWQVLFNQIAFQNLQEIFGGPQAVDAPVPADTEISFIVGMGKKAALRPYLSGVPYLVTVQDSIKIMPGGETRFDVMLPPLLRFELSPQGPFLAEQMPFMLSHTWFGDSMAGTLCQSLPALLLPRCDGNIICPTDSETRISGINLGAKSLIHCELLVQNTSKAAFDLKQVAIYTDMLNVYEYDGRLVTDEIVLDSMNDGNLKMSVHHGQKKGYTKLSSSLNGGKSEVFIRRGAEFLKNMTSI